MVTKAQALKLSRFVLEEQMRASMAEVREVDAETEPTDEPAKENWKKKVKAVKATYHILNDELARREGEAQTKLEAERAAEREEAKRKLRQEREEAEAAERKSREVAEPKFNITSPLPTHGQSNAELNMKFKTVVEAVNDLEKFGPGCEPANFVRKIGTLKYVAKCDATKKLLLNMLFTRLSDEYKPTFVKYDEEHSVDTIDKFMEYITTQYESRKSIFQFMEQLDEVELRKNETLRDFGTRLEQKVFELETAVSDKFVQLKKKKDKTFQGEMTKADVFKLWGGMAMLKALQTEKGLYTHTITKADDCFNALDLANVAEAYKERSQGDTGIVMHTKAHGNNQRNQGGNSTQGNNSNSSDPNKKAGVCYHWEKFGRCKWNDKCRYYHDPSKKATNGRGGGNQRSNRQSNQGTRAKEETKPSAPTESEVKKPEPEVSYIQGAQVYSGFRQ